MCHTKRLYLQVYIDSHYYHSNSSPEKQKQKKTQIRAYRAMYFSLYTGT